MQSISKLVVTSAATLLLLVGCGHTRDLRTVAANDLRCPSDRVVVRAASGKRGTEVTGCGLSGRYRFRDGEWVREDAWWMSSAAGARD